MRANRFRRILHDCRESEFFVTTEAELVAYVRDQREFFADITAPATDFTGWLAFKLGCSNRDAAAVITWEKIQ